MTSSAVNPTNKLFLYLYPLHFLKLFQFHYQGQWTALLIFAGYCSTLGTAVPAGYCIGVMNSPGVVGFMLVNMGKLKYLFNSTIVYASMVQGHLGVA